MKLIELIITVLIPPLGVAMKYGISGKFWLNLILTILGYVPGLIHGIYEIAIRPSQS